MSEEEDASSSARSSNTTSPGSLEAVSVKPSPFWRTCPELWFASLEAQFVKAGISGDSTKYFTVVAALDESVVRVICDIILNPPQTNKYARLKEVLVARLSGSQNQQLKQLLNELTLGDSLPSQLLREIKALNKDNRLGENVLQSLWLQRLPSHMQLILSCNPGSLDELATCADKIAEVNARPELFTVAESPHTQERSPSSHLEATIASLRKDISELRDIVGSEVRFHGSPRHRSRSRGHRGNIRSTSSNGQRKFCWYHFRFGDKAVKCVPPCAFKRTQTTPNTSNIGRSPK